MHFFLFSQKLDKQNDPRLSGRGLRRFKIASQTEESAIKKYASTSGVASRQTSPESPSAMMKLTPEDVRELFEVFSYNYALDGEITELFGNRD